MTSLYSGLVSVCVLCIVTAQNVRMPPEITKHPAKLSLFVLGSSTEIILKCEASGTPKPTFEWRKMNSAGRGIKVLESSHIKPNDKRGLVIKSPTKSDEGFYQCVARGTGAAMSQLGEVREAYVRGPTAPILVPNEDLPIKQAFAGHSLQLECNAPASYPSSIQHWQLYPNDATSDRRPRTVETSERIAVSDEGNLLFSYVEKSDAHDSHLDIGWHYICVSYNPILRKSEFSSPVKLQVDGVDPDTKKLTRLWPVMRTSITAIVGKPFSLKCVFGGKPAPKVEFVRNSPNIFPVKERVKINEDDYGTMITIKEAEEIDQGVWECVGKLNGNSDIRNQFAVQVESEPVWTGSPENINATVGDDVTFYCLATGKPNPVKQFYIDAQEITESTAEYELNFQDGSITFFDVKKPDSVTVVQCKVSNRNGYSYKSGYLNVLEKLEVVEKPAASYSIAESDDNKKVAMICHVKSDPSDPVVYLWLKDGQPLKDLWGYSQNNKDGLSELVISMNHEQKGVDDRNFTGIYSCFAETLYNKWNVTVSGYKLQYARKAPSPITGSEVLNAQGPWWVAAIVGGVILVVIVILILCMVLRQGETYAVGKKERAAGHDPLRDDSGFHDYVRPSQEPTKGSSMPSSLDDSFYSDYKPAYDDGMDSVIGMDDIDPGKFNEDGSFIGAYGDDENDEDEQTQVQYPYQHSQAVDPAVFI